MTGCRKKHVHFKNFHYDNKPTSYLLEERHMNAEFNIREELRGNLAKIICYSQTIKLHKTSICYSQTIKLYTRQVMSKFNICSSTESLYLAFPIWAARYLCSCSCFCCHAVLVECTSRGVSEHAYHVKSGTGLVHV